MFVNYPSEQKKLLSFSCHTMRYDKTWWTTMWILPPYVHYNEIRVIHVWTWATFAQGFHQKANISVSRTRNWRTCAAIATRAKVKLLDFGISKDTMATSPAKTPIGTPMYMAPEVPLPCAIDDYRTYHIKPFTISILLTARKTRPLKRMQFVILYDQSSSCSNYFILFSHC